MQIRLDEGWWTYWRAPGASGMPPMFDWSGCENLADEPETIWPVPIRAVAYCENVNVYRKKSSSRSSFAPPIRRSPSSLHLKIAYGVCRNMCVPSTAEHEMTLHPTAGTPKIDPENAKLIDAFTGRSPSAIRRPPASKFAKCAPRSKTVRQSSTIRIYGLGGEGRTLLLIEGPNFVRVTEVKPGRSRRRARCGAQAHRRRHDADFAPSKASASASP